VTEVAEGRAIEALFLGQHPHVVTLGRGTDRKNILTGEAERLGIERPKIIEIERGGDATYHGPGQLVGYPIVDLSARRDLHKYLRDLEQAIIDVLTEFGLEAGRRKGLTGVWIGPKNAQRKIASIGIAVRRWIAYHGFALNVSTDLRYFRLLNPCGLDASVMTNAEREKGTHIDMDRIAAEIAKRLGELLGIEFALRK
jgi:lipoyl(octanoyl) transferase